MRLSISHKLIIAFLGLTLVVLAATLGLARWSFERGFLDYVNALEQVRLERVPQDLAREYTAAGGNWSSLTPDRFGDLLRDSRPAGLPDREGPGARGQRPPPPGRGGQRGPPTAVYDSADNRIVGTPIDVDGRATVRLPVVVAGNVVGELRSAPRRDLTTSQETAFAAQQTHASIVIGAVCLILALGLSLLLARGLLAPVRRMIDDVNRLSNGDYSVRMSGERVDELGRLMGDLNRLAITLEESRTSRRRWLADVSHELRTPVTALSAELEGLQDGVLTFDRAQVDSLHDEVQRLRHLIDDLYELSLSDVGGLRYQFWDIRLDECLAAVVKKTDARAKECGINVEVQSEPVTINADEQRMVQLVQNLLDNALAYTDAPGQIHARVFAHDNGAVLEMKDSPPGVESSEYDLLFEPLFRREESRSRRTGGAGLGLSICRKIVEAHGGTIVAIPSSLGGLCVRVELPMGAKP